MYRPTLEEARKLMEEHNKEAFHRQHAETVSGVMGYFAKEYDPENEEFWRCVGMLHDLDYEEFPEEHCIREQQWLEVSSCSCFTDYQARRLNCRFKDADGKTKLVHTLNGSGVALPRLMVALLEQHLQEDGSVLLPEVLRPYFGADRLLPVK